MDVIHHYKIINTSLKAHYLTLYSETCDEGTPQKVSLHDRCPLIAGTFQC